MKITHRSLGCMLYATTALCVFAMPVIAAAPAVTVNYDQLDQITATDLPAGYTNERPISSPLAPNKPIVLKPLPRWAQNYADVPAPVAAPPLTLQPVQAQDIVRQLAAQAPPEPQIITSQNVSRPKLNLVPPPPKTPPMQLAATPAVPIPQTQIAPAVSTVSTTVPLPKTQIAAIPVATAVPSASKIQSAAISSPVPKSYAPTPNAANAPAQLAPPVMTVVQPEIVQRAMNNVAPPPKAVITEVATKPDDMPVAQTATPVATLPASPAPSEPNELRAEDVVALDLNNPGGVVVPAMPAVPTTPVTTESDNGSLLSPPKRSGKVRNSSFMSSLNDDDDNSAAAMPVSTTQQFDTAVTKPTAAVSDTGFTSNFDNDAAVAAPPSSPAHTPRVGTAYDLPDVRTIKTLEVPAAKSPASNSDKHVMAEPSADVADTLIAAAATPRTTPETTVDSAPPPSAFRTAYDLPEQAVQNLIVPPVKQVEAAPADIIVETPPAPETFTQATPVAIALPADESSVPVTVSRETRPALRSTGVKTAYDLPEHAVQHLAPPIVQATPNIVSHDNKVEELVNASVSLTAAAAPAPALVATAIPTSDIVVPAPLAPIKTAYDLPEQTVQHLMPPIVQAVPITASNNIEADEPVAVVAAEPVSAAEPAAAAPVVTAVLSTENTALQASDIDAATPPAAPIKTAYDLGELTIKPLAVPAAEPTAAAIIQEVAATPVSQSDSDRSALDGPPAAPATDDTPPAAQSETIINSAASRAETSFPRDTAVVVVESAHNIASGADTASDVTVVSTAEPVMAEPVVIAAPATPAVIPVAAHQTIVTAYDLNAPDIKSLTAPIEPVAQPAKDAKDSADILPARMPAEAAVAAPITAALEDMSVAAPVVQNIVAEQDNAFQTQMAAMVARTAAAEAAADQLRAERDAAAATAAQTLVLQQQLQDSEARAAAMEQEAAVLKTAQAEAAAARAAVATELASPLKPLETVVVDSARDEVAPTPVVTAQTAPVPATDNVPTITPSIMANAIVQPQLATISFAPGSDTIDAPFENNLDQLAKQLKTQTGNRLTLQAYANNDKTASGARRMSLLRAMKIRDYLNKQGVPMSRIDVQAMGGVSDNSYPDRVDMLVN